MTSNGGVATADEVIGRPIATVLSGPAAGAVGAAMIAQNAGITSVLTCDGGGTSTDVAVVVGGEPALTTEGSRRRLPVEDPDGGRRHRRRGRRVGGVGVAGGLAQGRAAVGGR